MFLSSIDSDEADDYHELDFRFEYFPEEDVFVFAHHGATLHELLEVCGEGQLGSMFYLVEMSDPLHLSEALKELSLFEKLFEVAPSIIETSFLLFNHEQLSLFFKKANDLIYLDCTMIGGYKQQATLEAIKSIFNTNQLPLEVSSVIHTHDNHFLWLRARSLKLLRKLINASLIGFFNHLHPRAYSPIPNHLIDLILSKYHTTPLVSVPTVWVKKPPEPGFVLSSESAPQAVGFEIDSNRIQILVETQETSWIAHKLNPPKELVGRGLFISYSFKEESWAFEELV